MFVRSAGEHDLAAVRDLLVETWHATYDPIYGAERVTALTDDWHSMRALQARLTRPRSEFLVADSGKEIGGMAFAKAREDGKVLMLHQLYVRPSRQGHGIGGMLLDEILNCFPEAETVRLEVEEANARAIAFYEAYGFKQTGRTANCGGGQSGIPALVMERPLGVEPPA
jgi:ribosomal protein S18 acetylase RimI-like enzyme